jgi:hypothetical protein
MDFGHGDAAIQTCGPLDRVVQNHSKGSLYALQVGGATAAVRDCNACNQSLPITKFSTWAIKGRHKLCRICANSRSKLAGRLRRGCMSTKILATIRRDFHKAGWSRPDSRKVTVCHVEALLHRFGHRSIFSGTADRRLTVARWDKDLPVGIENLIVCTSAESGAHSRRKLVDYHAAFVAHVEANLLLRQGSHNDRKCAPPTHAQPYPPLRLGTPPGRTNLTQIVANWNFQTFGNISPAKKSWVCLT